MSHYIFQKSAYAQNCYFLIRLLVSKKDFNFVCTVYSDSVILIIRSFYYKVINTIKKAHSIVSR